MRVKLIKIDSEQTIYARLKLLNISWLKYNQIN